MTIDDSGYLHLNAETFQKPLASLAEVIAQKVKREAPKMLSAPGYVPFDLYVLIKQAMRTYDLFFYLNADERKKGDPYFRPVYSILIFPLVRNMIDGLYNITFILQDPALHFRGLATARSSVRLMQVNRRSDSPDAQVDHFHKH